VFGVTFEMCLKKADRDLGMSSRESLTERRKRVEEKAEELFRKGIMEAKQLSEKKSAPQFCADIIDMMVEQKVRAYGLKIMHNQILTHDGTPEGKPLRTKAGQIKRKWTPYAYERPE
jgi:hypothetical protein